MFLVNSTSLAISLSSSSNLQPGCFHNSLLGQLKVLLSRLSTIHKNISTTSIDTEKLAIAQYKTKASCSMLVRGLSQWRQKNLYYPLITITPPTTPIKLRPMNNMTWVIQWATKNLWYRIIFLLRGVADKYGKEKTVHQLMSLIHPFNLVPLACTCLM